MATGDVGEVEARIEEILAGVPPHTGIQPTLTALETLAPTDEVLPIVRRLCADHPSPHVRFHAERVLRAAPHPAPPVALDAESTPQEIATALEHPDPEVRLLAVPATRALPPGEANRLLRAAVNRPEEDPWVLATLIMTLGEVGGEGVAEEASVLLDHPSPRVAANALLTLHRAEPATALYAAHFRLDSLDNRVRTNAILAIYDADPAIAWNHVRDMATSPDVWMRASGCYLAATLEHAESEDLLIRILRREEHPEIIVRALGWLEDQGGEEALGAAGFWSMQADPAVASAGRRAMEGIRRRTRADQAAEDLAMGRFLRERRDALQSPETTEDPLLADLVRAALETGRVQVHAFAPPAEVAPPPAPLAAAAPAPAAPASVGAAPDTPAPVAADTGEHMVAETGEHVVADTGEHVVVDTGEVEVQVSDAPVVADTAEVEAPVPAAPPPPAATGEGDTEARAIARLMEDPPPGPAHPPAPVAGGDAEATIQAALELLRGDRPREAIELLQPLLPRAGAVPSRLRWALALGFLKLGEVGLSLQHVDAIDPGALALAEVYVLALGLEQSGAISASLKLYENVQSRRLGYRDVEKRLGSLKGRRPEIPEDVWLSLATRFRDLVPVGRGGMGQVLAARERNTGRPVAVKVPDRRVLEDPKSRDRFLRELETLAALDHPHVVKIYEVSRGEVPYYSMELITGQHLGSLLHEKQRLSPAAALDVLTPIAEALAFLHEKQIIHRDVKPANILIDAQGSPRLSDFGIVYLRSRTGMTSTGIMLGTMAYMAPEQLAGYPPTPAIDIYSFGVVLYETLTGRLPFETSNAVLKMYRAPPPARSHVPDLPADVDAALAACLEREPRNRPADGGELLTRLLAMKISRSGIRRTG